MLAACGSAVSVPSDPDAPILQIRTDGGFAPIEWILSNRPTYTLLADGRLIVPGPAFEFYPGPLVLNYQVSQVGDQDFEQILDLVAEMGLPEMTSEIDDSAAGFVADAGTEVVTFWDAGGGIHQYSVYALGIELDPENPTIASNPETAAFMKLDSASRQVKRIFGQPSLRTRTGSGARRRRHGTGRSRVRRCSSLAAGR